MAVHRSHEFISSKLKLRKATGNKNKNCAVENIVTGLPVLLPENIKYLPIHRSQMETETRVLQK